MTLHRTLSFLLLLFSCVCIFIGAISSTLTPIACVVAALVAFMAAEISQRSPSSSVCKGILTLLCLQNAAIGLGAHMGGNSSASLGYLTQIPFICIGIIWVYYYAADRFSHKPLAKIDVLFIILLVCILLAALIGRGTIQSMAITVRNLTVFYMVYKIGFFNLNTKEELYSFVRYLILFSVLLVIIGELLLLGGYPLQRAMGIHEVYIAKGSPFPEGTLDARFYTTLVKTEYLRMGSLYFEPINLAYLFSAALIASIFVPVYKDMLTKGILSAVLLLGLIQTVGKGGYLILGCVTGCFLVEKLFRWIFARFPNRKTRRNIIISVIFIVVIFFNFYVKHIGAAIMPHIWGIQDTWENVLARPWGHGLGTGGNAAQIVGDASREDWFGSGGETALMSYAYQIGLQGVFCFVLCVLATAVKKYNTFTPFFYIPIILLGVSLMQDNTFTPQCITAFMLMQGGVNSVLMRDSASVGR